MQLGKYLPSYSMLGEVRRRRLLMRGAVDLYRKRHELRGMR